MRTEWGPPQVVFAGGSILTMDPSQPRVEALGISGDRIVAAGPLASMPVEDAEIVQLGGRTLSPGLIDAHNHLSIAALHPRWRDAGDTRSTEEVLDAVRAAARDEPSAPWIRVRDWPGPELAPVARADLDRLELDRPIVVAHSSLHQAVVDSRALEVLQISATTPDPAGGEIERGHRGQPTGLLIERAWSDAHRRSLAAFAEPDRWGEHIERRAQQLVAEGITAVHDAACSPEAEAVYRQLASRGRLPVSVLAMPHPAAILSHEFGSRLDGPTTGEGDEQFRVGPVKLFADGGVAIAIDVSVHGHRITSGITMRDLEATALTAAARGWRLAIHAIGNVGVDRGLDAFEAVARRHDADHRFRVEHALVTGPTQWSRLAALGVVGVVQPGFVEHVGEQSGGVHFDDHRWLAFAALAEAGVILAGSSDDPCAPVPPLWCAHRGETRTTSSGITLEAGQSLPLEDWLRAYTSGAAIAGGQEHERGTLRVGARADLVLIERDPATAGLTVSETWIAGRRVHPR